MKNDNHPLVNDMISICNEASKEVRDGSLVEEYRQQLPQDDEFLDSTERLLRDVGMEEKEIQSFLDYLKRDMNGNRENHEF